MSSIFKRDNGTWYFQWRVNEKQCKRSLKTDNRDIARKRAALLELKMLQGSYGINTFKTRLP